MATPSSSRRVSKRLRSCYPTRRDRVSRGSLGSSRRARASGSESTPLTSHRFGPATCPAEVEHRLAANVIAINGRGTLLGQHVPALPVLGFSRLRGPQHRQRRHPDANRNRQVVQRGEGLRVHHPRRWLEGPLPPPKRTRRHRAAPARRGEQGHLHGRGGRQGPARRRRRPRVVTDPDSAGRPGLPAEISNSLAMVWKRYAGQRPGEVETVVSGTKVACVLRGSVRGFDEAMAAIAAGELDDEGGALPARTISGYKREAVE